MENKKDKPLRLNVNIGPKISYESSVLVGRRENDFNSFFIEVSTSDGGSCWLDMTKKEFEEIKKSMAEVLR